MPISGLDSYNVLTTEQKNLLRELREKGPFENELAYLSFRDRCIAAAATDWPDPEHDLWLHIGMSRSMVNAGAWSDWEYVRYIGNLDLLVAFTERAFNQGKKSTWDKFSPQRDPGGSFR